MVGWEAQDFSHSNLRYTLLMVGGMPVSGLMAFPEGACEVGARPGWIGYVRVDDVEAFAARVKAAGGAILRDLTSLPFGRIAIVADPQGAPFVLFKPSRTEPCEAPAHCTPGRTGWHELHAADQGSAFAFYADLFGWTTEAFGPATMFRLPGYVGGEPRQPVSREVVATMSAANGAGAPGWGVNLWDRDVDATTAKAVELGGRALAPPFDTPMTRMAVLADPGGAAFSIANVPG